MNAPILPLDIIPFPPQGSASRPILAYHQTFEVDGRKLDYDGELWRAGECPHPHKATWPHDPEIVASIRLSCPASGEVFYPVAAEVAPRPLGRSRTLPGA